MKKRPIFQKILIPLLLLLILESIVLILGIVSSGIIVKIEENEKAVVEKTVDNRKIFLENQMVDSWMNISYAVENINRKVSGYIREKDITVQELDDSSASAAGILQELSGNLISMMRTSRVTGAFIILNAEDLTEEIESGVYEDVPGLYLKDSDPLAQGSTRNADLLVECAPISVLQSMGIASNASWDVEFAFSEHEGSYMDFYSKPFQLAYDHPGEYTWRDMGYWSAPFKMLGRGESVITYSVPLVLENGTVYGVLGIDITAEYLRTLMPYSEMDESGQGAYFLAKQGTHPGEYIEIIGDGNLVGAFSYKGGNITLDSQEHFYYASELTLYNNNAPFSKEQWILVGAVPMGALMEFVKRIEISAIAALLLTMLLSMLGSIFISYIIQRPIAQLSREVRAKDTMKKITLSDTGIKEIDEITDELETLSYNVIESGKKFTQIIKMASVRIAGFQIDKKANTLFVTEDFFKIFGIFHLNPQKLTVTEFTEVLYTLKGLCIERNYQDNYYVFRIPKNEEERFVSLKCRKDADDNVFYGLAEDVTKTLLEKKRIEYERDHDALTDIYNRRAFVRKIQELFDEHTEQIRNGAFLMLDLDNLKYINDTYGHNYGDAYIQKAAEALRTSFPKDALYARISGDEFNVFVYGYDTKEEVEVYFRELRKNLDSMFIELPGEVKQKISASGGVAWYPQDSTSVVELSLYADHTMYLEKKNQKGNIGYFNKEEYKNFGQSEKTE